MFAPQHGSSDEPRTVVVRLPAAPPGDYLRWMAYWREIEQAMAVRPALERHAASLSAPFVREATADHISGAWVTSIIAQATDAKRQGSATVEPQIDGPPELVLKAAGYVQRRGRWLQGTTVVEAMGIRPLEPHLVRLRGEVVKALKEQASAADLPGPTPASEASS